MGSVRCEVKERYFMAEYQYIFARYDFPTFNIDPYI
jgi:hypothetical protein